MSPLALSSTSPGLRATAGNVHALYMRHGAELRQVMARLAPDVDPDDLLHELFVLALQKAAALNAAQSPRAWLFGVAVKLAATRRRTARLRQFFGLEAALKLPAVDAPSRSLEQRDAQVLVARTLARLSPVRREVLVLFELQGLSGLEIAEALGIPLKTVWTRLFHARRQFAEVLERDEPGSAPGVAS